MAPSRPEGRQTEKIATFGVKAILSYRYIDSEGGMDAIHAAQGFHTGAYGCR